MQAAYAQATSKPQVLRILEYYTIYNKSSLHIHYPPGWAHVGIEDQKARVPDPRTLFFS